MGNHVGARGLRDRDETNALPHPHPPHDQPHPSRPTGTPASSPSVLPTFTNLHATHGYTTLPGPHQTPRPRIRTTHALKTQTTSPKTLQIHSISPKWSALWAHPSPTPPMWKQQQGLRGLPQCPWATEPGQTSETTHRATLAARTASRRAAAHGHRHTKQPDPATTRNDYDSETSVLASPATPSPRASRRARPR